MINSPTCITSTRNSILDVIMTDMKNIAQYGCVNCNISDHLPGFVVKKRLAETLIFKHINL